jgi:hypothetical protein
MYVTSQTKNTRPMLFQGDDIYFQYRFYNNTLSRILTNTYYPYYYRQISFFIYIKIQFSTNSNISMVIFSLIHSFLCISCPLQPCNLPTYEESVFRQLKKTLRATSNFNPVTLQVFGTRIRRKAFNIIY